MTKYRHDSLIGARCFVKSKAVWCYGEVLLILCGIVTFILSIWCLYRMFKYQNEAKSAVRTFIIYLSIMLSLISILHGLFVDGSSMSLTSSFLVSLQCSLFTVFFIKICIRTNADTVSISMVCERRFQIIFLFIMTSIECAFFLWSLIRFDINEIDCHTRSFMAFAGIDVAQILCTIIAVCFIKRKLNKQHQKVSTYHHNIHNIAVHKSALIKAKAKPQNSPGIQSLSRSVLQSNPDKLVEQQSLGQIQMLQKSHQLLLLVIFIFICAVITAIYETWNFVSIADCATFVKDNDVLNEILRLIARITWLFIPSWLIIYVFWIWPIRPKKYVSDDSLLRRETEKQEKQRMLKKICCLCFCNEESQKQQKQLQYNVLHNESEWQHVSIHNGVKDRASVDYEADNRIISEYDDHIDIEQNRYRLSNASTMDQYSLMDQPADNDDLLSSNSSESMRGSDIWDQHITTASSLLSPHSNVLS